jgi:DNA adenine methylase
MKVAISVKRSDPLINDFGVGALVDKTIRMRRTPHQQQISEASHMDVLLLSVIGAAFLRVEVHVVDRLRRRTRGAKKLGRRFSERLIGGRRFVPAAANRDGSEQGLKHGESYLNASRDNNRALPMLMLALSTHTKEEITLSMNSPFAWPGGKHLLKKRLLTLIPQHDAYVEVFCGSAKLLFAKEPSRWEIVNDLNDDVTNFFRVVRHRSAELAELLDHEFVGFSRFRQLRRHQRREDELQAALRFIYLAWWSFGGKGEHFATYKPETSGSQPCAMKRSIDTVRELLDKTAARLRHVLVDQRDFEHCIERYDSKGSFFYCDPPYVSFSNISRYQTMPAERHERLLEQLSKIKGKFLLSYDDADLVRDRARKLGFRMKKVPVSYTLAGNARTKNVTELLIANYDISVEQSTAAIAN